MLDQNTTDANCRSTWSRLSDYADNSLSARERWEVEKHLAACADCAKLAHRTTQTIQILRSAETLDTSDNFMAQLHAKLDSLGPVPARRTAGTVVREWLDEVRARLNFRALPTLSVGMASFILAALLFSPRHGAIPVVSTVATEMVSQEALDRHVAVTASNPFDDPVAAKLEADSGISDSGARIGTN